jgi:hypothetical protein
LDDQPDLRSTAGTAKLILAATKLLIANLKNCRNDHCGGFIFRGCEDKKKHAAVLCACQWSLSPTECATTQIFELNL